MRDSRLPGRSQLKICLFVGFGGENGGKIFLFFLFFHLTRSYYHSNITIITTILL